jgi:hypothetical protein
VIITFNFNFSRFNQQLSDTLETKTPGQEYFLNIQYIEKSNIACYDFHIKKNPFVCRRVDVLFTLFVFIYVEWCSTHIVLCFYFVFLRCLCPML